MGLVYLGGVTFTDGLRYSRDGLEQWQLWRLFSGHFVHLNFTHMVMNGVGFLLALLVVGKALGVLSWLACTVSIMLFIALSLFFLSTDVAWYVGFSGVLHGILALGLGLNFVAGDRVHGVAFVLLLAKVIREQLPSFDVFHMLDTIGGAVVVQAHLYGVISGGFLALMVVLAKKMEMRRP